MSPGLCVDGWQTGEYVGDNEGASSTDDDGQDISTDMECWAYARTEYPDATFINFQTADDGSNLCIIKQPGTSLTFSDEVADGYTQQLACEMPACEPVCKLRKGDPGSDPVCYYKSNCKAGLTRDSGIPREIRGQASLDLPFEWYQGGQSADCASSPTCRACTTPDCGNTRLLCAPNYSCAQDDTSALCMRVDMCLTAPATCSDGQHNQDEAGVDCGGANCSPCQGEFPTYSSP